MTAVARDLLSKSDADRVRQQLKRVTESAPFQSSLRRQRFLGYLVAETLEGRGERLKAYTIAVEVFERPETFDPLIAPLVRIEAGRLRDKLREYYAGEGRDDPVRIDLPKGSYVPLFAFQDSVTPEPEIALALEPRLPDSTTAVPAAKLAGLPSSGQILLAAAAAILAVGAAVWLLADRDVVPIRPERPSIAVLPFDSIGDDATWDRFAVGITEDIIFDLSQARDLIVIARTSTDVYRGQPIDVRKVGRDLNVKYVLEGSIQPMGERIRVTAQLIEAGTGSHVWSQRYDRPADDLFAVQNAVTQQIAATLMAYKGVVAEAERGLVRRKPPSSLTAYDTYLLGMEMKHNVTQETLFQAERLFRKAITLDPHLARAYVGLADVYFYLIDLGLTSSVDETRAKMLEAAETAVEIDPNDGKAHLALGYAYQFNGKVTQGAEHLARAEALAPSDADVLLILAWSLPPIGESKRAAHLAERAILLNPNFPPWYNQGLSYAFFFDEQFERAVTYRLNVKEPRALDYAFLAMSYAYLGKSREAESAAASVVKEDPAWSAEKYLSEGGGYAAKEAELFVEGARKAKLPACVSEEILKSMPQLIRVRSCDEARSKSAG